MQPYSTLRSLSFLVTTLLIVGCDNGLTGTSEDIQGFWKVTALGDRPFIPEYVLIADDQEAYYYDDQGNNVENSQNCYIRTKGFVWDIEGEEDVYEGLNIRFKAEFDGPNIIGRNTGLTNPDYGDFLLEPVDGLSVRDLSICS